MKSRPPFPLSSRLWLAVICFWLAGSGVASAQYPILLAEKNWAVGYILVGLCIFLGLLAICIPRLRRIEMVEEESADKAAQGAAAPARPSGPFGQFGQQPGYGQPGYGQQPRPQAAPAYAGGASDKSRMTAGLLGIFLGAYGVHRFYLGYTGLGFAMLAVTFITCGVGGIWGFIDGVMVLAGTVDRDAQGRLLQ